jgi:hypothetical protein
MVSLPDPVAIVLAEDEPVTAIAVVRADASTFSKFVTSTPSPEV